jgi:hypothetical protein
MTQFLETTKRDFNLDYRTYDCPFQEGVRDITETRGIRAIFMGVREGDPHAKGAEHMHPSSTNWPAFMRVYPILTWKHADGNVNPHYFRLAIHALISYYCAMCVTAVWMFMRDCSVPYCSLYDKGYTSIGLTHNTVPNPALRAAGVNGEVEAYLPAHCLAHTGHERGSRVVTTSAPPATTASPLQSPPKMSTESSLTTSTSSGYNSVNIIVLYESSRMGSYISSVLEFVGSVGHLPVSMQLLAQHYSSEAEFEFIFTAIRNAAANGYVIVVGDFSFAGIFCISTFRTSSSPVPDFLLLVCTIRSASSIE